jgi:hypothetical protein
VSKAGVEVVDRYNFPRTPIEVAPFPTYVSVPALNCALSPSKGFIAVYARAAEGIESRREAVSIAAAGFQNGFLRNCKISLACSYKSSYRMGYTNGTKRRTAATSLNMVWILRTLNRC